MDEILQQLKDRYARIGRAIAALEGEPEPQKETLTKVRGGRRGRRGRRKMSAAAKKQLSIAAKRRWKEAKKSGKNSL